MVPILVLVPVFTSVLLSFKHSFFPSKKKNTTNVYDYKKSNGKKYYAFIFLPIPGFKTKFLSHVSLSIYSLHVRLNPSLFQRCLQMQTLASNLHLRLQGSCYSCFITFDIRLNTLTFMVLTTSGIHNFAHGSLI